MNKRMTGILWLTGITLLLAACGPLSATATPAVAPDAVEDHPAAIPSDNSGQFRHYIGSIHPPLAQGLTLDFGMLIQDHEEHSLSLVTEGPNRMLWLSKLTHYDADGAAYWQVQDVLDLSHVGTGLMLLPDGCSLDGVPDSEIIVLSRDGKIQLAWRANTTAGKFEVIPTAGLECLSDKAMDL